MNSDDKDVIIDVENDNNALKNKKNEIKKDMEEKVETQFRYKLFYVRWGILISQCRYQTLFLVNHKFSIGNSRGCNVRIHDYSTPIVANLLYENNNANLEVFDSSMCILLNGNELTGPCLNKLNSGDEITFSSHNSYLSFIVEIFDVPVPFTKTRYENDNNSRNKYGMWGSDPYDDVLYIYFSMIIHIVVYLVQFYLKII